MKKLLFVIFAMTVNLIGCEIPYTGPLLSVRNVDRYLNETGADTVCIQDGFDSVCLRVVVREVEGERDTTPASIIHIHPTEVLYEFYYGGHRVLRAERTMDTAALAEELIVTGKVELPPDTTQFDVGGVEDADSAFEGWRIQMYYPASFPETFRGNTLETSGFEIRIVEGTWLPPNTEKDLEIINFTQIDGPDGSRIAQFDVETNASKIILRVRGLVQGHIARFRLNTDGVASDEDTNTFELRRIQ